MTSNDWEALAEMIDFAWAQLGLAVRPRTAHAAGDFLPSARLPPNPNLRPLTRTSCLKRIFQIVGILAAAVSILAAAALLFLFFGPSLMHTPSPEEIVPVLARQELREFHLYFGVFKDRHWKEPESIAELLADGRYLNGVVEPHRTRILRHLEYPVSSATVTEGDSPVLATYHVPGFGEFLLLENGEVLEQRLKDYRASSFERAQREEGEIVQRQLDDAATRRQPARSR